MISSILDFHKYLGPNFCNMLEIDPDEEYEDLGEIISSVDDEED